MSRELTEWLRLSDNTYNEFMAYIQMDYKTVSKLEFYERLLELSKQKQIWDLGDLVVKLYNTFKSRNSLLTIYRKLLYYIRTEKIGSIIRDPRRYNHIFGNYRLQVRLYPGRIEYLINYWRKILEG